MINGTRNLIRAMGGEGAWWIWYFVALTHKSKVKVCVCGTAEQGDVITHKWRDVPVRRGGINSLILISTAEGATLLREITNLYAGHLWTRQEPEQKMIPYSQEPGPDNLL